MEGKILYILGAGASANRALPLARSVRNVNTSLMDAPDIPGLIYDLENFQFHGQQGLLSNDEGDTLNIIRSSFKHLASLANKFGDIDTYAKYLYLMYPTGNQLAELKKTLSLYFTMKQMLLEIKDSRYLPWLVAIMEEKKFPENVKILSWNYDFQVELAAQQIGALEEFELDTSSYSYSAGIIPYYPSLDPNISNRDTLSLIHLNGIAGFLEGESLKTENVFQKKDHDLDTLYLAFGEKACLFPLLHFAWEKGKYHSSLTHHIGKMIIDTSIMVVIGYSFPFFNREMDKKIFELLTKSKSLKKIYYQDPVLTGQQLRSQFGLKDYIDIVHIPNTSNFHIPFEY